MPSHEATACLKLSVKFNQIWFGTFLSITAQIRFDIGPKIVTLTLGFAI